LQWNSKAGENVPLVITGADFLCITEAAASKENRN
jgi:hypothetical protein